MAYMPIGPNTKAFAVPVSFATDEGGVTVAGVSACKLAKGGTVAEEVACTNANTDYPMANAMAGGTKYLEIYCDSKCIVAMGAAATSTNGLVVPAGQKLTYPVTVTGTAADDKAHVQSATAGAVVRFTSMAD